MRRIAIVAPIVARYDAISAAAVENHRLLAEAPGQAVTLLTAHNEIAAQASIVAGLAQLLADPAFRAADLLLYHFGIFHPLHDAMLVGNGHARQLAVFHNITPPALVPEARREVIDRSLRQAHNLAHADGIWADSAFNAADLAQFGVDPARVRVMPLGVGRPALASPADKPRRGLHLLYVGRIVPAKGVHELIQAVLRALPQLPPAMRDGLRLTIAGNRAFSDADYIRTCEAALAASPLAGQAEIVDTPDDAALCRLYTQAHLLCIPSHHEGFCVPVVEGLRAGCIPLGYAAGNIPAVAGGLGRLVACGDIAALAGALTALATGLNAARQDPAAPVLAFDGGPCSLQGFGAAARTHLEQFEPAAIAQAKRGHVAALLADLPPNPYAPASPVPVPPATPAPPAARAPLRQRLVNAVAQLRHRPTMPQAATALAPVPAPATLAPPAALAPAAQASFTRLAHATRAARRQP